MAINKKMSEIKTIMSYMGVNDREAYTIAPMPPMRENRYAQLSPPRQLRIHRVRANHRGSARLRGTRRDSRPCDVRF